MWRVCLIILISSTSWAQSIQPNVARMDAIVERYVAERQFMGSVLVARDGEILFSKGYGQANLEWNIPNSPETKFRLGSLTKQFTAASILLLEEQGKLNTDDPVKKHWPEAPAAWDKIKLFHLLTHSAGLPNFTALPEYSKAMPVNTPLLTIIESFQNLPLEFQPGDQFRYSNSGYIVLGLVIEKLSGMPYGQFLRRNIFDPLDMKDSGYDLNAVILPRRASGYTSGPNGFSNAPYIHMSVPHAAGALYSTTGDLLRWEQVLFGGKLLTAASLAKMTTPFKDGYAFGLGVQTQAGRKTIGHNGGINGFNTRLTYYPDTKVVVAVLSNVNGNAPDQIAPRLGAITHGDPVEPVKFLSDRKPVRLPADILSRYTGSYEADGGNVFKVIAKADGMLSIQPPGGSPADLLAESETSFFVSPANVDVEFTIDASGKVTALKIKQGPEPLARRVADQ